jgi:hypothetical protein
MDGNQAEEEEEEEARHENEHRPFCISYTPCSVTQYSKPLTPISSIRVRSHLPFPPPKSA